MLKKVIHSIFAFALVLSCAVQTSFAQDADASAEGDVALGEKLFKNNCAQCHAVDEKKVVGPGMKGIEERRDYAWLKKWINNPNAVIASGDKYAVDLYNAYNKTQMTAFPSFGDTEIKGILAYIKVANEAPAAAPADAAVAAGGTAAAPAAAGGGEFFTVILVVLLVIMALVLVALLAVLQLLTKLAGVDGPTADGSKSPMETLKANLQALIANKAVRSAVVWMFILLATKATFDGMFGIGVHQGYAPKQPISFSHKLHAGEYEIDCAYCHTGVYKGKQAGIPSANICMNCHNQIKRESPEIQKIYTALEKDQPIEWIRVHNLPDLAYFNHAQHTNVAGLECTNCHGEIPKMEVVQQRSTLTMGWCIDCHRKSDVNAKGNAYYDNLLKAHQATSKEDMKVEDLGGLECAKCHY